jgi:hypothetical protein
VGSAELTHCLVTRTTVPQMGQGCIHDPPTENRLTVALPVFVFLTEYSCRIAPVRYPKLIRNWFDAVSRLGLKWGTSFDLDYYTIPYHGDDALV